MQIVQPQRCKVLKSWVLTVMAIMRRWSAGGKIVLAGFLVAVVGSIAAVAVVPEVRYFLGLDQKPIRLPTIQPKQARDYIKRQARVCGSVAGTGYAQESQGQPTFLNFDKPYPNTVFTVVIWAEDRAKFGRPEIEYRLMAICVTGEIEMDGEVPEIVARSPAQIELVKGE